MIIPEVTHITVIYATCYAFPILLMINKERILKYIFLFFVRRLYSILHILHFAYPTLLQQTN